MSLVLDGDLFTKFGTHLPTPIIERVEVLADSVKVGLSLYFKLEGSDLDGIQQTQIENDLQNLNIYAVTVYGDAYRDRLLNQQTNIFEELYSSNSDFSASYLKVGAESGIYVSASAMFETSEGQDFMVNTVNWDFNYDGAYDGGDMELYLAYCQITGNVEANTASPSYGYSLDWVTKTGQDFFDEIPIPDSMDPSSVALPIHKNGFEWAAEKMAMLLQYSSSIAALQLTVEDYVYHEESVVVDHATNFEQIAFDVDSSSIQLGEDPIYDENDNLILKYQCVAQIKPNFNGDYRDSFSKFDSSVNIFNSANYSLNSYFNKSMTLFAFSSFVDYNSILNGSTESYGIDFTDSEYTVDIYRRFVNPKPQLHSELMRFQTSDLSYKTLFVNGELDMGQQALYVIDDGTEPNEVYDNVPLRSITGRYYNDSGLTREDLYNSILELGSNPATGSYSQAQTQEAKNSLLLIAAEYQYSTDLLQIVDEFRRSFPDKTSAMYDSIKSLVFSSNRLLKTGLPVIKKLVINNVVVDKRDDFGNMAEYESNYSDDIYPIYAQSSLIGSEVRLEYATDEGEYPLVTSGYWFFDQEMALKYNSNLCQLVNIDRLENVFSKEITNLYFYVTRATVNKYVTTDAISDREVTADDFSTKTMYVTYNNSYPYGPSEQLSAFATGSIIFSDNEIMTGVPQYRSTETMELIGIGDNIDYCYIIPRAWDLYKNTFFTGSERTITLQSETLSATANVFGPASDYRMQCFEFQEISSIYTDNPTPNDKYLYSFGVSVQDNTLQIMGGISSSYHETLLLLEEYVGYASDHCSYNNLEGRFNDFFVDSMRDIYGGIPPYETPWVLAASTYHAHADLLLGVYDGSKETIAMRAKETVQLINPTNGTLDNLVSFYEAMSGFYEDNYGESGIIAQKMAGMEDLSRTYPVSEDPMDAYYAPLPAPAATYALLLEEIDPSWTERWEQLKTLMINSQTKLNDVIVAAMSQKDTIVYQNASLGNTNVGGGSSAQREVEIYKFAYNSSFSNIHVWLEGGARGPSSGDTGITVGTGPSDDPTNDYWVAATELAIVLDSIRKFSIFSRGPDDASYNGEPWPQGTYELFKSINKEYLAPYFEEMAELYKDNRYSHTWELTTMGLDDEEIEAMEEAGASYLNMPFTWTTSWPISRISTEYDYTQPAKSTYDAPGDTLPVTVDINELQSINWNLSQGWIDANDWNETSFGAWLVSWAPTSFL
jgi:hypothetical protein